MHCAERWEADDHLSLVANIRGSQIRALEAAGIRTVRALATAPSNTRPSRLAAETFATLRAQARLQIEKRNTGEDRIEILPPSAGRGFARLPESDPGDLFFDMEGDPFQPDGLEYLFGVHYREDGERRFRAFWAHDQAQEKAAFEDFMDFVEARRRAHPNTHI